MEKAMCRWAAVLGAICAVPVFAQPASPPVPDYPPAPRADVVDVYHGERVADPFRPLEDVDAADTRAWVEANQRLTGAYLAQLPGQARLQSALERIWNQPRYGLPQTVGAVRYLLINDGLQPQPVLYRQPLQADAAAPAVVLDINALSADGTTALKAWRVSPDGRYLAYGLAEAGQDWTRIHVRDLRTGQDLPQVLSDIKYSNISWTHDSGGFFYARYPRREGTFDTIEGQSLWYHRVGTAQTADVRVYADPEQPRQNYRVQVDDSGRWLLIAVYAGSSNRNALWVQDLRNPRDPQLIGGRRQLINDFAYRRTPIGVLDDVLYVHSTANAERGRVRALDLSRPGAQWITVVPEMDATLVDAALVDGIVITHHLRNAVSELKSWSPIGEPQFDLTPPGLGAISGLRGAKDRRELFFQRSSPVEPRAVWRADLTSGEVAPWRAPQSPVVAADFVTEQHFATSRDGTRVPYFLSYRRGLSAEKTHPTWLYGYGGFNIPLTPAYRVHAPLWMQAGGVFVVANLRGGGEFGEAWHRAGTLTQKQNVFDDFIAVADDLIARGWTTPKKLAIHGRSNGGLLVGAVTNQRPELFAAAMPGVGVMDMLRFHTFTIGWAWTGDYGSAEDPAEFRALRAYSPLHNIRAGVNYPPVLVYTADHDDRVVPGHSFKYAAALQNADTGPHPTLLRIESRGGHGAGKPTAAQIAEARDLLLFAGYHTGLDWQRLPQAGGTAGDWQRLIGK